MKKFLVSLLSLVLLAYQPVYAATVQFGAQGILFPYTPGDFGPAPWATSANIATLNANTTQFVVVGYVYQKDTAFQAGGTKTIDSVSWATSTKTCAACADQLTVTAETVGTSGPPAGPSGTILASGGATSTKAFTAITSAGVDTTTNFTTAPTVHFGDYIAFRFAVTSHDTGSIGMAGVNQLYSCGMGVELNTSADTGATWSNVCKMPMLRINFHDGTTGSMGGAYFMNAFAGPTTDTYNSGSGFTEVGIGIQSPITMDIDGLCAGVGIASVSATFTLELTDTASTPNVLASTVVDPHYTRGTGTGFNQAQSCFGISPITLTANTAYRLGVKATSANNITTTNYLVNAAADFDTAFACGQECVKYTRAGAAWSAASTTTRPYMAVRVSAFDIGSGPILSSGGGLLLTGVGH